jgi:hypothetical protein
MRLLTHNSLQNNSAAAKGKGYPLKITATEIKVDDRASSGSELDDRMLEFVKNLLPSLQWNALVQVSDNRVM